MKVWPTEVDDARPFPTIFAQSFADAQKATIPYPYVAIVPDYSTYNNFGRIYWSKMYVLQESGSAPGHAVMLMFEGQNRTRDYLEKLFAAEGRRWLTPAEVPAPFVTLFNEEGSYASIVQLLGFPVAVSTLRAMGDAVVLDQDDDRNDERHGLLASQDFHEGVVRVREAYAAYRRGARHLTPNPRPLVSDARGLYRFASALPGSQRPVDAAFDFRSDELMRDRLAVLIGRNGVGKTQLVQSMIEGWRTHPENHGTTSAVPATFEAAPDISRLIVLSSVASDTYPRRIPAWSGLDYEYLSLVAQQSGGGRSLLSVLLDCVRDPADQPFQFGGKEVHRFGLLQQLVGKLGFWDDLCVPLQTGPATDDIFTFADIADGDRYVRLSMLNGEQRTIRVVSEADHNRAVAVLTDDGGIRQLSSGEAAMLRFAVHAVSCIERGSFLVLEEPETYLHPNFVSELMSILHDLLEATSSVALAVTHSAYVVREATRQRVNVMRRDEDHNPEFVPTPLQTFGASVDSISQFVFGDGGMTHQYQETLRRWLKANPEMTVDRLKDEYALEFNPETMAFLVRTIRDADTAVSQA